jgi:membrane peptidoglycan carboxypeptidase
MSATTPRQEPAAVLKERRAQGVSARVWVRRGVVALVWILVAFAVGWLAAREARTSALQARLIVALNERIAFPLEPGPSPDFREPRGGPYDRRLGYVRLPEWTRRLVHDGFRVAEQTRFSPALLRLAALGVSPPYHEKTRTGLTVRDRNGNAIFASLEPQRGYADFDSIPPLVRDTLLFVENRELLAAEPRRNPAVEWDRLARAVLFQLGSSDGDGRGPGGSTLATQMEKYRHSPGGLTSSPLEKLRQLGSASLRAYRDGEDTSAVRQTILLDYLNSLPLAAVAGRGEILGLAAGLVAKLPAFFATAMLRVGS